MMPGCEILEHKLENTSSLVFSRSERLVEELEKICAKADEISRKRPCGVLIQAGSEHSDLCIDDYKKFSEDILCDELFIRLVRIRSLFKKISVSNAVWLFHGEFDCLGVAFELAQCCDFRFFFNGSASIGFPLIDGGVFPCLFGFETLIERTSLQKKFWLNQSVFLARDAFKKNLIDFCDPHPRSLEFSHSWLKSYLSNAARKILPTQNIETLSLKNLESTFQKARSLGLFEPTENESESWDICWRILRFDKRGLTPAQKEALIVYVVSRQMLQRSFLKWLEVRIRRRPRVVLSDSHESFSKVYIDLNQLVPPEIPMIRLLKQNKSVVFFAEDEQKLADGLSLMYMRFSRHDDLDLSRLWKRLVGWFVGDVSRADAVVLRWFSDDLLRLNCKESELEVLRFSGNRGRADCGWCEWSIRPSEWSEESRKDHSAVSRDDRFEIGSKCKPLLIDVAKLISDGIIRAKVLPGSQLRLSLFVRSMFLEELIHLCREQGVEAARVLNELRMAGWGYGADEAYWQYFLRSRKESYSVESSKVAVGPLKVSSLSWQIGLWKEVREITRGFRDGRDFSWHRIRLSQHFAIFCGFLANVLYEHALIASQEQSDRFVSCAVGFPKAMGTPLMYIEQIGRLRYENYTDHFRHTYKERS